MIAEYQVIRRLEREMHRFYASKTLESQVAYTTMKLAIAVVKTLAEETHKHLADNPRAVAAICANIHRTYWKHHRPYVTKIERLK